MQELRLVGGCFGLRRSLSRLRAQVSKVSKVFRPGCCGRGFGLRWFERLHWRAGGWVCFWVCEGVDMDWLGSSQAEGL
jgi:hypothetical protein